MEKGDQLPLASVSIDAHEVHAIAADSETPGQRVLRQEESLRHENARVVQCRHFLLCVLFVLYVTCSLGLPALHADEASCDNGLFWEDHIPFYILFVFTKLMELCFYATDPTIEAQLDWKSFMLKFLPSTFAYIDAYSDATAIVITRTCPAEGAATLAQWMIIFYIVGVIVSQWLVSLSMACRDPTSSCLMKILHWDVCAALSCPQSREGS